MKAKGRPQFQPTAEQRRLVAVLTGMLVPIETIAENVGPGISTPTLRKHFKQELRIGREQLLVQLKVGIYRQAQNGSVRALTWLIERLGGPEWRAVEQHVISGTLGTDLSGVPTEELTRELDALRRKSAAVEREWVPPGSMH